MSIYNDDLLLIHIPKCGGTSCRDYLLEHLPGAIDSLSTAEDRGPLPIDSTPLRHIEEHTGRPLDSWQKIVIPIRNPYHQIVSHWSYHWTRYAQGGRHLHDRTAALHKTVTNWLTDAHSDFRVWYHTHVRRDHGLGDAVDYVRRWGFYEYWSTTEDGEVPPNVEFIRCESLSDDFPKAVEEFVTSSGPFPYKRSSPHGRDPFAYMSPAALDIIHDRFRWAFAGHYDRKGA